MSTSQIKVIAVDPGVRKCGVAVFIDGILTRAATVHNPEQVQRGAVAWDSMLAALGPLVCDVLVVEQMQIDGRPPREALAVQFVAGLIVGAATAPRWYCYQPRQWKGSTPKHVTRARLLRDLSPAEVKIIEKQGHDAIDAVGIGRHYHAKELQL